MRSVLRFLIPERIIRSEACPGLVNDPCVLRSRGLRLSCAAILLAALACCSTASAEDVLGTWAGSGRVTNDWPKAACVYAGTASPPSVILDLQAEGRATLRLEIPAAVGSACPPLKKRHEVQGVAITDASIAFRDPAGHEWTLGRREGVLKGIVAWKAGMAADEPLVQGVAAGADVPMTRLSGEVELRRSVPPGSAPAPASGSALGGVVSVLGANVVGVGALVLANRALQDDKGTTNTNTTCSLRNCIGDCVCENPFISGQSCGDVPGGVGLNQACVVPTRPCQAQLSCNNGFCQDQAGLCPF